MPAEHEHENSPAHEQIRGAHEDRNRSRRKTTKKRERGPVPGVLSSEQIPQKLITAKVIGTEGAFFLLLTEKNEKLRAKSYKSTRTPNPNATLVAVGDEVRIDPNVVEGEVAVIDEILPRRTKLSRHAAGRRDSFEQVIIANVDLLVIVASVGEPKLRSGIIDRYIVAGIEGGLGIAIAINKIDLASPDEMDEALYFRDLYSEIGYPVHLVSTVQETGIENLKKEIAGKTSVFAGHSGVGKSSIVNAILGREAAQIGAMQRKHRGGAHTTAKTSLIEVPENPPLFKEGKGDGSSVHTYIADTPGVREFANFELDTHNLKFAFAEFLKFQEHCRVPNCSHIHEPGCAVRQAVEDDKISIDRYSSYQKLFEETTQSEVKRLYNQ
ncbi:MAG TPA: ribosome small subunit-dependent GTPase A [Candidatus Kapabacteria bacterium]